MSCTLGPNRTHSVHVFQAHSSIAEEEGFAFTAPKPGLACPLTAPLPRPLPLENTLGTSPEGAEEVDALPFAALGLP